MNVPPRTIIRTVRDVMPARPVNYTEALLLAERQATLLLKLLRIRRLPVDVKKLGELPQVVIEMRPRHEMPGIARVGPLTEVSGFAHRWDSGHWRITVNRSDSYGRRRFSLAHEFKHVLDYPTRSVTYRRLGYGSAEMQQRQIKQICDHFAACLLMPRGVVRRVWASGIRDTEALAGLFETSIAAMQVRLHYLGLSNEAPSSGAEPTPCAASDTDLGTDIGTDDEPDLDPCFA